jgi:hypothetical protein
LVDNFIEVHLLIDIVLAGGIDVSELLTGNKLEYTTNGYSGGTVHVDQHAVCFYLQNPNRVFSVTMVVCMYLNCRSNLERY